MSLEIVFVVTILQNTGKTFKVFRKTIKMFYEDGTKNTLMSREGVQLGISN